MTDDKESYIVQYKVRDWWHDYYSYCTAADAFKSMDHLPECVKERPTRIVKRVITETIITQRITNG